MAKKYKKMNFQFIQLVLIQFKEFLRSPGIIFWGVLFPILMAWGLGIAFTEKPQLTRKIILVSNQQGDGYVMDYLKKNGSKEISQRDGAFYQVSIENDKTGKLSFRFIPDSWENGLVHLKRGNAYIIITDNTTLPEYHFDPLSPDAQLLHLQLKNLFKNKELLENTESIRPLELSGTRYIDFLIPGLIVMGVMMSCMWGISYSLIEKRSRKLLRRMVATPMKKHNFLISMLIARLSLNLTESIILFLFAWAYFGIQIQGSIAALLSIYIAGNIAFVGIAVFVSSRTSKTEVGNGLINAITTPMLVLSGIFFSYHNFPDWVIGFIEVLPLTMMVDCIRSIFNEGAGFVEIANELIALLLIGFIGFVSGLRIFKWY